MECYAAMCQHHTIHFFPDDGPFCGTKYECVYSSCEQPIFFFAGKRNDEKYRHLKVLKTRNGTNLKYTNADETLCQIENGIPTFNMHGVKHTIDDFEGQIDVETYAETVLKHHGMEILEKIA